MHAFFFLPFTCPQDVFYPERNKVNAAVCKMKKGLTVEENYFNFKSLFT